MRTGSCFADLKIKSLMRQMSSIRLDHEKSAFAQPSAGGCVQGPPCRRSDSCSLAQVVDALRGLESWDEETIHKAVEELCIKNEVGMGKIAQPIRVAITGSTISPGIGESLVLLGKYETIKRIEDTLEYMKQN